MNSLSPGDVFSYPKHWHTYKNRRDMMYWKKRARAGESNVVQYDDLSIFLQFVIFFVWVLSGGINLYNIFLSLFQEFYSIVIIFASLFCWNSKQASYCVFAWFYAKYFFGILNMNDMKRKQILKTIFLNYLTLILKFLSTHKISTNIFV